MISGMLLFLLSALALVLGAVQSRTIRDQIERRGLGIARSLAAASMADLSTYNYVALERSANEAAGNPDIEYVIIHDKEGRVAGFSRRPDLQSRFLEDAISKRAVASTTPLIQERSFGPGNQSVIDVAVPVFLADTRLRWGTIRLGLSLVPMYRQINQTQWTILGGGLVALALGILVSMWAAKRVTSPLENLVHATVEAARGNLNPKIPVKAGDEVEILASNFSAMIQEILDHRKQLEWQLTEIKRLHLHTEKLLTTMSDGLLSIDMDGKVATINPAVYSMLNIPDNMLKKGDCLKDVLSEDSDLYAYTQELFQDRPVNGPKEIRLDPSDQSKILLVGWSRITDEKGRPQEIILNLHDITELKKLEARIRQTERLAALGTLAAGLSHEIRNPLSAIKTFVQLLPRKIDNPGFLEKFQRTVPREINRINQLIEDLLDMARPPKYHFDRIDIGALLTQTLDLMEPEWQSHNIQCKYMIPDDLPRVRADSNQLVKAFQNLIQNAVQAMPDGGTLTIRAFYDLNPSLVQPMRKDQNGRVTVIFQDTGPGIPPDILKNIFNPFFTTKDDGTGLGLAITHKVITEHGGNIDVSSSEETGTCFTIGLSGGS